MQVFPHLALCLSGCVSVEFPVFKTEDSLACIAPLADQRGRIDFPPVTSQKEAIALFSFLLDRGESGDLRVAWQLAALCPSPGMAQVASQRLARFSAWHATDRLYVEVADAVVANKLVNAYPLIRPSFMHSGSLPFAKAMVALDPESAADDFLSYLAIAGSGIASRESVETVMAHLADYLPSSRHPLLGVLLHLASQPEGKSARQVAANMLKKYPDTLRFSLQRVDENTRRAFLKAMHGEHPLSAVVLQDLL